MGATLIFREGLWSVLGSLTLQQYLIYQQMKAQT